MKRVRVPMVFDDLADLEQFLEAAAEYAQAPKPVLCVTRDRALAALRATGRDLRPDDLAWPVYRHGLNVTEDALFELAYRCRQAGPLTAADLAALRQAALAAYGWQAHLDVEHREHLRKDRIVYGKGGGDETRVRAGRKTPPTDDELKAYINPRLEINRSLSSSDLALTAAASFKCGSEPLRKRIGKLRKNS